MKPTDYSDQIKIFDPEDWHYPIHIIGAGTINSLVGLLLAKMGIQEIHVWDDDLLEQHNLPTEVGYSTLMCGKPKVTAMADAVYYIMSTDRVKLHQHQTRVTADTELSGIVISGVNSVSSRKAIWQCVRYHCLEIPFYIDARSHGEQTQIFAFDPYSYADYANYETWLFDDTETVTIESGARNIAYISAYMASEICRLITLFHRGIKIKEFPIIHDFANE